MNRRLSYEMRLKIGRGFRRARVNGGYPYQIDLSRAMGIERKAIQGIESGTYTPNMDTLQRYVEVLGAEAVIEALGWRKI